MSETKAYADRSLYYYELNFCPYRSYEGVEKHYVLCFKELRKLIDSKDKERFLERNDCKLFLGQLEPDSTGKYICGILYKIRNDIFPQIIDLTNEAISDFDIGEEKGLVEATHFVIELKDSESARLIVEYNHYGARTSDLIWYLYKISKSTNIIKRIGVVPIVRDRLDEMREQIKGLSKFIVKVHKDNINRISDIDQGLGHSLYHANSYSNSEYVSLELGFDYKLQKTNTIKDKVITWIEHFTGNPTDTELFNVYRVYAENDDNNDQIEQFDLLLENEKSVVSVEKKPRSRVLLSEKFFPIIIDEFENKFS